MSDNACHPGTDDHENHDLSQFIVNMNVNRRTSPFQPCQDVEHRMIREIDRIIGRYLSRPDWSSPYCCTFDWDTQGRQVPSYTVKLFITEPTRR